MAVDLSRVTFDPSKHYSGLVHQQGRVSIDADLNEAQDIRRYREETTAIDVIGPTGYPRGDGGYAVTVAAGSSDLLISAGRMYVHGIMAELTPAVVTVTMTGPAQVTVPNWDLDGHAFAPGQYVQLAVGNLGPALMQVQTVTPSAAQADGVLTLNAAIAGYVQGQPATMSRQPSLGCQPDSYAPPPGLKPGWYRAYLDVWNQEETWIQDPQIREIALGGPDTAGRLRIRAQVKIDPRPVTAKNPACQDAFGADWAAGFPATTGTLAAEIDPGTAAMSPCLIPPGLGYQGPENQFYRVQIDHSGNDGGNATIKWQRDNASVLTPVTQVNGTTLTVANVGLDDSRGFSANDLVEPSDDRSDLDGVPYPLQVVATQPTQYPPQIQLKTAIPAPGIDPTLHAKLARWDGSAPIPASTANQWIALEGGLQVFFAAGYYQSGDYWLIPARTATGASPGTIEWPADDAGNALPLPPAGKRHHYAPLALVHFNGVGFDQARDCRTVFPPLTAITANDVSFNDTVCQLPGVSTVQQAIDALCGRTGGICTLTATPGAGWESVFSQLLPGADARICLPAGKYPLPTAVTISNLGNLTIEGAGPGTRLTSQAEAALIFSSCASVTVRNLYAETGTLGSSLATSTKHLNGALTFTNCPTVEVESVSLACPSGTYRAAGCLTVSAAPSATYYSTRIRSCLFTPGHQQVGVLAVNQNRVTVEDCEISVGPALGGGETLLDDSFFRDNITRLLVGAAYIGKAKTVATARVNPAGKTAAAATTVGAAKIAIPRPTVPHLNTGVSAGGFAISFLTNKNLASVWSRTITAQDPQVGSPVQLLKFVKSFTGQLLTSAEARAANPAFAQLIMAAIREVGGTASAGQAIVVAGQQPTEARIIGNTIRAAIQGIHVGVSPRGPKGTPRSATGPIQIRGNTIDVVLTPDAVRGRQGIFVGNCDSVIAEANRISLQRTPSATLPVDAIRIWGFLGRMVIVSHNYVQGFSTGANVQPMPLPAGVPGPGNPLWLIADNLLGADQPFNAPSTVHVSGNIS
jgi:hypothetical protein